MERDAEAQGTAQGIAGLSNEPHFMVRHVWDYENFDFISFSTKFPLELMLLSFKLSVCDQYVVFVRAWSDTNGN